MSALLADVMSRLDELHRNPNSVTGKATGFVDLDEMTTGLQDGDLIIVAGRPAMGKSSLALNIAEHIGLELKLPVLFYSMEMGGEQLALRLLGSVAKVDSVKFVSGDEKLKSFSEALRTAEYHITFPDDTPVKVFRRGTLSCSMTTRTCTFTLMLPDDVRTVD